MTDSAKRERVLMALRGGHVDRVPASIWLHNFGTEVEHSSFVNETVRLARRFGWDYLKPQSRAECFPEMWGLEYRLGLGPSVPPTVTRYPVKRAQDFASIQPMSIQNSALGEQLRALSAIRKQLGPDIPMVWTVFSPLVVARQLLPHGQPQLLEILRSDSSPLRSALEAITATLIDYAREAVARGADGIFLATSFAPASQLTAAERAQFERPLLLDILRAVEEAPFNILHLCGDGVSMQEYADYPVSAYNWADGGPNPSLAEGHSMTGRAVMGGLPPKPRFGETREEEFEALAEIACAEMKGRWMLLAPGCSVNPGTPDAMLASVAAVIGRLPPPPESSNGVSF